MYTVSFLSNNYNGSPLGYVDSCFAYFQYLLASSIHCRDSKCLTLNITLDGMHGMMMQYVWHACLSPHLVLFNIVSSNLVFLPAYVALYCPKRASFCIRHVLVVLTIKPFLT